jgi:hypothetical protein
MRAAAILLKRWAAEPIESNWAAHEKAIRVSTVNATIQEVDARVDEWLKRWGVETPDVDTDRFASAVTAKIRAGSPQACERRGLTTYRLLFRIGAPLAAAAAIALVVTSGLWAPVPTKPTASKPSAPVVLVSLAPGGAADGPANGASVVFVAFDREPCEEPGQIASTGISFMTMGSAPLTEESAEVPPL